MADALNELIKSGAEKAIDKSAAIFTAPCTVVSIGSNGMYTVKLVTSDAQYTVRNYSGSDLAIGEPCQLYYRNNVISNQTAYIGAAAVKNNLSLIKISRDDYDAITPNENTIYYVVESNNSITQYLGNIAL